MSGTSYVGRTITDIALVTDQLLISFADGFQIVVVDDSPRSPGSRRYMTTGDDLRSLIGHQLVGLKQGVSMDYYVDGGIHAIAFICLVTHDGDRAAVQANVEHDGSDAVGFGLVLRQLSVGRGGESIESDGPLFHWDDERRAIARDGARLAKADGSRRQG